MFFFVETLEFQNLFPKTHSLSCSFKVGLLVIFVLVFPLGKCLHSSSTHEGHSHQMEILISQSFALKTWKVRWPFLLVSEVLDEESAINDWSSHQPYIISLWPLSFLASVFSFQKFNYDVSWTVISFSFPIWVLLSFLNCRSIFCFFLLNLGTFFWSIASHFKNT